jgi:hypothetical protein
MGLRGEEGPVDPELWGIPDGYVRTARRPIRNWVLDMSLIAEWEGPVPTEPGECSIILLVPKEAWANRSSELPQVETRCAIESGHLGRQPWQSASWSATWTMTGQERQ